MIDYMLDFAPTISRELVFEEVRLFIAENGLEVVSADHARPWGGFFVLNEAQSPKFIKTFFPQFSVEDFEGFEKLSPKILVVAPETRLSWQYHHRRSELWKVIGGTTGVIKSMTDEQNDVQKLRVGAIVNLKQGERHRLVGLESYGIVAEIWQHTDPENPSDEEDIVRVSDDFGR